MFENNMYDFPLLCSFILYSYQTVVKLITLLLQPRCEFIIHVKLFTIHIYTRINNNIHRETAAAAVRSRSPGVRKRNNIRKKK